MANFLFVLVCLGALECSWSVPVVLTVENNFQDDVQYNSGGNVINDKIFPELHSEGSNEHVRETGSNVVHHGNETVGLVPDRPDVKIVVGKRGHETDRHRIGYINETTENNSNSTYDIHLSENGQELQHNGRQEVIDIHRNINESGLYQPDIKDGLVDGHESEHVAGGESHIDSRVNGDTHEEILPDKPESVSRNFTEGSQGETDEHSLEMKALESEEHQSVVPYNQYTESVRNLPDMGEGNEHPFLDNDGHLEKNEPDEELPSQTTEQVVRSTPLEVERHQSENGHDSGSVRHLPDSNEKGPVFKPDESEPKVTTEGRHITSTERNRHFDTVTEEGSIVIDPELHNKEEGQVTTEGQFPEVTQGEVTTNRKIVPEITEGEPRRPFDGPLVHSSTRSTTTKIVPEITEGEPRRPFDGPLVHSSTRSTTRQIIPEVTEGEPRFPFDGPVNHSTTRSSTRHLVPEVTEGEARLPFVQSSARTTREIVPEVTEGEAKLPFDGPVVQSPTKTTLKHRPNVDKEFTPEQTTEPLSNVSEGEEIIPQETSTRNLPRFPTEGKGMAGPGGEVGPTVSRITTDSVLHGVTETHTKLKPGHGNQEQSTESMTTVSEVTEQTGLTTRESEVKNRTRQIPQESEVTDRTSQIPQESEVTDRTPQIPQESEVTEGTRHIPQQSEVTDQTSLIPQVSEKSINKPGDKEHGSKEQTTESFVSLPTHYSTFVPEKEEETTLSETLVTASTGIDTKATTFNVDFENSSIMPSKSIRANTETSNLQTENLKASSVSPSHSVVTFTPRLMSSKFEQTSFSTQIEQFVTTSTVLVSQQSRIISSRANSQIRIETSVLESSSLGSCFTCYPSSSHGLKNSEFIQDSSIGLYPKISSEIDHEFETVFQSGRESSSIFTEGYISNKQTSAIMASSVQIATESTEVFPTELIEVNENTSPTRRNGKNVSQKPGKTTQSAKQIPPTTSAVYIKIDMKMTLYEFCQAKQLFISQLADIMGSAEENEVSQEQLLLRYPVQDDCNKPPEPFDEEEEVEIQMYVLDTAGNIDISLTMDMAKQIKPGLKSSKSQFSQKLESVNVVTPPNETDTPGILSKEKQELETGITIAIAIAAVGGFCCVSLLVLQIIIHKRSGKRMSPYFIGGSATSRLSMRSMDSIALGVVPKSRPHSGFWNPGLDLGDEELNDPSHPLVYSALTDFSMDTEAIHQEFQLIPSETPRLSCVPVGAEDKNRFANVIPHPHTRVRLMKVPGEEFSEYINANYVTGYKDDLRAYIATQAPMSHTAIDFWRMVWEQQSRVVLMLTEMDERGQPRCLPYWPEKTGMENRLSYGDFYIVLKKKEVHQEYIVSILEIKNIEKNLVREIRHFWYTCWPSDDTPEPISVVKFLLDTRPYYEDSGAPVIVHCSPGTGRTGTLITIDICMRSYEDKRSVNILNTVYKMRKERAGAVQTRAQYNLIYKAVNEYAVVMSTPTSISTTSSVVTLQNML